MKIVNMCKRMYCYEIVFIVINNDWFLLEWIKRKIINTTVRFCEPCRSP